MADEPAKSQMPAPPPPPPEALLPALALFVAWDLWASRRGMWGFSERYTLGLRLPGGMVVEELVFFVVVPLCALLTLEAVREILRRRVHTDPESTRVPVEVE